MKITILGAGVPADQLLQLRNKYPPAIVVEFGSEVVLFDCGEGTRFRLVEAGFQYASIEHIAITHIHADHFVFTPLYQAIFVHGHWGGKKSRGINVYGPSNVINNIGSQIEVQVPELHHSDIPPYPTLNLVKVPGKTIQIGNGKLKAESVYHGFGLCEAVAFRLETPEGIFVYSGDSGECKGIRSICQDADIFVCEASAGVGDIISPNKYGHLSPDLSGSIAKEARVKKLVLTHYSGFNSDEEMISGCQSSGFGGQIILAKDGQVIEV